MTLEELIAPGGQACTCGREHRAGLKYLKIGQGAVRMLPEALAAIGCAHPLVVCDLNTERAAMPQVLQALQGAGIPYELYRFDTETVEPDERAVGSL